jgi:ATP-dependent Clp protease ATP-binding subunit ClpA
MGFSVTARDGRNAAVKQRLLDALRHTFRPEFLNRVDDIIVFNSLSREHLRAIVDIQLAALARQLEERGVTLELAAEAKDVLIDEGYDPQFGARPMKRAIQRLISDPLAVRLLNGDFAAGDTVVAGAGTGGHELEFTKLAPAEA